MATSTVSRAPRAAGGLNGGGRESAPLTETLIYGALRELAQTETERGQTFADAAGIRFFGVRDIIEALERLAPVDPETGETASFNRSTVAMRLKRMRENYKLVARQVADAGAVRGTIGNVYALPPQGMTETQMAELFKLSGEEATQQAYAAVNRQLPTRAPRRPSTREERTTRLYGQVSWKDAREANRLADLSGMRRPQYVAEAIRRFNEEKGREIEQERTEAEQRGRRSVRSFAPPLLSSESAN